MGLLRVALAFCVVLWHLSDQLYIPVNGYVAVTCFYIISGFYMAMILNETYVGQVKEFYLGRFLRLFPTYWVICLLVATYWIYRGHSPTRLFNLDLPVSIWLPTLTANAGIFGLDAIVLAVYGPWSNINVLRLVGPAWSLAIELQFYLVAPFIVTRSLRFCVGVLIACLALRFAFLGWPYDPWRYFFAPTVWCFFMLGAVAYRLFGSSATSNPRVGYACLAAIPFAAFLAGAHLTQDMDRPRMWAFYLIFAGCVPFIFAATKTARFDNELGKLSYPMYLVHPIILIAVSRSSGRYSALYDLGPWWSLAGLAAVVIASVAIMYLVERPIERLRKFVKERPARSQLLSRNLPDYCSQTEAIRPRPMC